MNGVAIVGVSLSITRRNTTSKYPIIQPVKRDYGSSARILHVPAACPVLGCSHHIAMLLAMLIDPAQIVVKSSVFNASCVDDGILLVNHEARCTERALQKLEGSELKTTWART
jgi:hypothetical protein